jgi:hypothetical protein
MTMMDPLLDAPPDLPDLVIVEARRHAPGFYETPTRVFYVTQRGDVFLLRAPGAPITVQQLDDLPPDAEVVARSAVAEPHRQLAAVLDHHARRLPPTPS